MQHAVADDGTTIAYRVVGDGPRTVLAHAGGGLSSATWHELLSVLDLDGIRFVAHDTRGTGRSDRPAGGYDTETLASDLIAVADAVGVERFALLGHSMGGKISQFVSCRWPERVRGQMLLVPSPATALPAPPEFEALVRSLPGNWEAFSQLVELSSTIPFSDAVRERVQADYLRTDPAAYAQMLDRIALGGEFVDQLGKTTAPTLFVATDDPATPVEFVRQCAAHIPGAMVTYLPGPGHWAHYVMPREVAAVFRAFMAGLAS